ncbi:MULTISPECIES: carbohydrate porin [Trichocoleus]|uniref:Porin n=1 Tax=Trichocoleus desertorum GB2-A4 TaxID=2933944 RepID=A0ABV0J277_9CYAN|nr:carbohydrate porin [Trichocoleus sp. FACHB-46]MBD1860487.1 hypothetical protein [Trichocoleus sp. FACHB-46]
MLDSRWSIFRSYLLSLRVLASGSISLLLFIGLTQVKPSWANSPRLSESTPQPSSQSQAPATQSPSSEAKLRNKKATPQARSTLAAAALAPLKAPQNLSNTEADLVHQIAGSRPEVLAKQVETAMPSFIAPQRSPSLGSDATTPSKSVNPQRSRSVQSSSVTTKSTTKTSGVKPSQTAPIKTADNYWQMNGAGLGVPGQYSPGICAGNCNGWPQPVGQRSDPNGQPLLVPTPLPTVRPETPSASFSPQQLPWMSGGPVAAPGWGGINGNAYPYPYPVGQLPPAQLAPMPPPGWHPYGWNPNGGFYPMGQPMPAPMPTLMVPGAGGPTGPDSSNNIYFYNRYAPSPQPTAAPVAPVSVPNLTAPLTYPNFYNGAPNSPNNFYNGAPNYPGNFYSPNPVYPTNTYSSQAPSYPNNYPGNIYNNVPGYPSNYSNPALGYPGNSYPPNSYPTAPGYPSNSYSPVPNYPSNYPNPALGYPGNSYPPNSYPPNSYPTAFPTAPNYPSNPSSPAPNYPGYGANPTPMYPGSVYNAAPNYPGSPYPGAPAASYGAPSPYGAGYPTGQPTAFPQFQNTPTPTAPQSTTAPPSNSPGNVAPAAALETRPETSSKPLLRSTALSEPSVQLQGVYLYQADESSARARLSAAYPLTPNILFGGALDLTTGQGLVDSQQEGLSLNELFVATSPRDLPNLRFVVGQLDLTSYFDRNSFAKDGASHFFNPVFQTNSALTATGIGSRPGALVNWALTDNIEARFAAFSSARSIGDFSLDGFAGELGLRYGNAIIRGTYSTGRETGAGDGFREIFQVNRGDGLSGPQRGDREEGFGINAEVFIPSLNMGLFGRYGQYNNRGLDEQGNTYNVGLTVLDVFAPDDRLGLAYGRQLSNAALRRQLGDRNPDVLELYYDFRFLPNLRLGFTLQELNGFSETIAGFRLKTEFDVTPKGRLQ